MLGSISPLAGEATVQEHCVGTSEAVYAMDAEVRGGRITQRLSRFQQQHPGNGSVSGSVLLHHIERKAGGKRQREKQTQRSASVP